MFEMSKRIGGRGNNPQCQAIGIDLGTTYSCFGVWQNNRVEIIPNSNGNRTTPSFISFTQTQCIIGEAAMSHALRNLTNTIFDVKRLIGRRFSDKTVQSDIKLWPFKVLSCPTKEGVPMIVVTYKDHEKHFFAEEISSMMLMEMKKNAEAYLGFEVKDAVITVPANFNDSQRQATKDAGVIAGLNVLQLLNESTAAAIVYGLEKDVVDSNVRRNVLVFDLGGGTLDVSLVTVNDDLFQVKAVTGDTHLGGEDFDNRLLSHFVEEFHLKHKIDISGSPRALQRLRVACERAKRALSSTSRVHVDMDCLYEGIDFFSVISRARFEELNIDLFEGCLKHVQSCLRDAKMEKEEIDEIVLVGGSTRIPKIQQLLQEFFDGKELYKSLNADEVVACGAAIQAGVLSGVLHNQHVMPVDVTPRPVGIEMENGEFEVVIPRNTPIPTNMEKVVTTNHDNQTVLKTSVYEGERSIAKENNFLASFELCGIRAAPRGISSITKSFEIDANGILTVTAEEEISGTTSHVKVIKHSERFSQDEIENMVKEAKKCMSGDIDQEKVMIAKANLEIYAHHVWGILSDDFGGLRNEEMEALKDAIEQTFQWLESNCGLITHSMFIIKLEELENICDPLISKLSKMVDEGIIDMSFEEDRSYIKDEYVELLTWTLNQLDYVGECETVGVEESPSISLPSTSEPSNGLACLTRSDWQEMLDSMNIPKTKDETKAESMDWCDPTDDH